MSISSYKSWKPKEQSMHWVGGESPSCPASRVRGRSINANTHAWSDMNGGGHTPDRMLSRS
eukprot:3069472-Prymnesium_polylepis.2